MEFRNLWPYALLHVHYACFHRVKRSLLAGTHRKPMILKAGGGGGWQMSPVFTLVTTAQTYSQPTTAVLCTFCQSRYLE